MNDKRFQNAMNGIPRVRVVDGAGRAIIENAYYWAIPATTFCFKQDYERHGYRLIEGVVTFDHSDWGLPNRPRFVRVTPPHKIEIMEDEGGAE